MRFFNSKPFLDKWTDSSSIKTIKLHYKKDQIFVLAERKEIVGFIAVQENIIPEGGNLAQIMNFAIIKENQNKGFGSKFLNEIEKILKKEGYKKVFLETYSKVYAVNFYKKISIKLQKNTTFMIKDL